MMRRVRKTDQGRAVLPDEARDVMLQVSDKLSIEGPLADPLNENICLRCETELYFECDDCKAIVKTAVDHCPECGSSNIVGPKCICSHSDCGED
jgi:hypothetical protein